MSMRLLLVLTVLFCAACSGPFAVFPGGRLTGESGQDPGDWAFAGDSGTCQLETNPQEPYSVNIACTIVGGALYVNAGDTETQWVENMQADPAVRLRIDGILYDLRAERARDPATIDAFAEAWTSQSMFLRDPRGLEEAWIYRLDTRVD